MIQWRNLNYDPLRYFKEMKISVDAREMLGVKEIISLLKKEFPDLRMGYFNKFYFRAYIDYEKKQEVGLKKVLDFCEHCLKIERLYPDDRAFLLLEKAILSYSYGVELFSGDPLEAQKLFRTSLINHIQTYWLIINNPRTHYDSGKNERWITQTLDNICSHFIRHSINDIFETFRQIDSVCVDLDWDVLCPAIKRFFVSLSFQHFTSTGNKNAIISQLKNFKQLIDRNLNFKDKGRKKELMESLVACLARLEK